VRLLSNPKKTHKILELLSTPVCYLELQFPSASAAAADLLHLSHPQHVQLETAAAPIDTSAILR
jgi:hypothetical protein